MTDPRPTVSEAIRTAAARLAQDSDTARLDAELLMAHALGCTRSDLLLRHTADPEPAAFAALRTNPSPTSPARRNSTQSPSRLRPAC
jgi:release factor glutamine methyltransferase